MVCVLAYARCGHLCTCEKSCVHLPPVSGAEVTSEFPQNSAVAQLKLPRPGERCIASNNEETYTIYTCRAL